MRYDWLILCLVVPVIAAIGYIFGYYLGRKPR